LWSRRSFFQILKSTPRPAFCLFCFQ
jgi:hypothetical protein